VASLFEKNKNQIAAVIVEPVVGNFGVLVPQKGFLQGLREITRQNGTLLIFDEVMTGFRVAYGGAQALYGVIPDLTCLGKIIGGGLPVGAYGGGKEIMDMVAPQGPIYQAGTLSGNPLAIQAGIVTLELLKEVGVYERLEAMGAMLEEGLSEAAATNDIPCVVNRVGSMFSAFFTTGQVLNDEDARRADTKIFNKFFHGMLEQGIYLAPSAFEAGFISTSHTIDDIRRTVAAAHQALSVE
jgi:glutamate-1-semialdehyde 2,1-aminomutase